MSDDIAQLQLNQYRRNERALDRVTKQVEDLAKTGNNPLLYERNFRYVVEFNIPFLELDPIADEAIYFSKSFVVNKEKRFVVRSMESALILIGTLQAGAEVARLEITNSDRNLVSTSPGDKALDFSWQVRDSGSDGQWQNGPIPANVLLSNIAVPLLFSKGRALRGGTEVTMDLLVSSMNVPANFSGTLFTSFSSFLVQVSFVGVEYESR